MAAGRATSAEDYKILSSFEAVRKALLEEKYVDRMEKPLAYWALPSDRRLPLAFLGRTIGDLLNTPFAKLSTTAGIGQKKISSLIKLLHRATNDEPPAVPFGINDLVPLTTPSKPKSERNGEPNFDPALVSEALWEKWCKTIQQHGLEYEKLGRIAPTLQAMPTVIWHTPINEYLEYSVSEIRSLKTHGEKRIRVVLEVFYVIYQILADAQPQDHLRVTLVPKFIAPIEAWIDAVLAGNGIPDEETIRRQLTIPLLDQIKVDTGDTVYELAAGRLGIGSPPKRVKEQSKKMGVTRARVYQLLDDCGKVMEVRWPDGRKRLNALAEKFDADRATKQQLKLFAATRELCFPEKYETSDQ
jgi:hypothetical protein